MKTNFEGFTSPFLINDFEALLILADRNGELNKRSTQSSFLGNRINTNTDKVSFGSITGTFPVAIAGAEGYAVIDLLTEEVLLEVSEFEDVGPFFGVVPVSQPENEGATFIAFGQNGIVLTSHNVVRGFESRILCTEGGDACSATTFDAFPATGDIISNFIPLFSPKRPSTFWDGIIS